MAENITADFTQSAARAVAASNIAHTWANGGDTVEIPTESGPLPSLRKFMYENVSEAENSRLDLVFTTGETSKNLSSAQFFGNVFFRVSGHTEIVDILLPAIAKVFYVENIGESALRIVRGSSFETVAMNETVLGYTDGTTKGLTLILPSEVINNYSATSAPTVDDDVTQGYSVGSRWIDSSEEPIVSYTAISVAEGAADWRQTGITIDDLGSMASQNSTNVNITGGTITGIPATTTSTGVVEAATSTEARTGVPEKFPDAQKVIQAIAANPWASQPIGGVVFIRDDLTGVSPPPTDNPNYRYIKLTAADSYNSGILTSESVTGTFPNITATSVINLLGSPMNGVTVDLINTERRFVRPGLSGTKQSTTNLSHSHTASSNTTGAHTHPMDVRRATSLDQSNAGGVIGAGATNNRDTGSAGSHSHTITVNSSGDTEARPINIGHTAYMRIL
jgi:hypothetical protein